MKIDGSHGEGGGQILRTAIALSAITGEPVEIFNIRAGRKNPGLRPQHLWGIKLVAMMSHAKVEGLNVGSQYVKFVPGRLRGGDYRIDVGTAGSITLLLQTSILPALFADEPVKMRLKGGTDVSFSPPIDYYRFVLVPLISKMGAKVEIKVLERGYYPQGGGLVEVKVEPSKLKPLEIVERGRLLGRTAYLNMRNLPMHVVERMKRKLGGYTVIEDVGTHGHSTGCGVVLVSRYENTLLGGDYLCRKGLPAEKVAEGALKKLLSEENSKATVDVNMGDHLIPFGFLAGGATYRVREITGHISTNAWVVENFGGKVRIEKNVVKVQA